MRSRKRLMVKVYHPESTRSNYSPTFPLNAPRSSGVMQGTRSLDQTSVGFAMRQRSGSVPWGLVIVGLVIGFGVLGTIGVWLGMRIGGQRNANQQAQVFGPQFMTPDGLFTPRTPRVAFSNPTPPDDEQKRSLTQYFTSLSNALADPVADPSRVFDFERMYDELIRVRVFAAVRVGEAPSQSWFVERAPTLLATKLRQSGLTAKWASLDIRRVGVAESGEVVVYAVRPNDDGTRSPMRFWFTQSDEHGWRLYDWAEVDVGLHLIHILGAEVATTALLPKDAALEWAVKLKSLDCLPKAVEAIRVGDFDLASDLLDACQLSLVSPFENAVDLVEGYYQSQSNPDIFAVERINYLLNIYPDEPRLVLLRALVGLEVKDYAAAIENAERYLTYFDTDAEALTCLARVREGQGNLTEAHAAFRKILADQPGYRAALHGFRRTLPAERKKDFLTQFLKAPKPHELYDDVIAEAQNDEDHVVVGLLAEWLHAERPNDLRAIKDLIGHRAHAGQPAAAIRLYQTGLKLVDNEERKDLQTDFLAAMCRRDHHLAAYAAVPDDDAMFAFDWLAYDLERRVSDFYGPRPATDKTKAERQLLDQLIAAHRQRVPADPWVNYFEGQQLLREKDYAAADKKFATGLATIGTLEIELFDLLSKYDALRMARTDALYRLGQSLVAHRDLRSRQDTFDQLARLHQRDHDTEGLRKLLDAHRAVDTTDVLLLYWTAQLNWELKEYDVAVQLLRRYAEAKGSETHYRYQWQVTDQVVRGLVRQNKPIEARDFVAERWGDTPTILQAVIYAASKDHRFAENLISQAAEKSPWMARMFYNDPDLGPHLGRDEYEPFRTRFPPAAPMK